MSLLDKFNSIEVKADTRISERDREFCMAYHEAYVKGRAALKSLRQLVEEYLNDQQSIISRVVPKDEMYDRSFFLGDSVHVHDITSCLRNAHHVLISALVSYFERTYKVSLEASEIEEVLLPKEPDRYASYNSAEYKEYYEAVESTELKYEDILDQIFIQLGGFSFQEKALNELKQKAHDAAWNRYYGNKCYEQKKAVISFAHYACSFDSWREEYYHGEHEIQLTDGMKNVIRALAYYECGTADNIPWTLNTLLGYQWRTYNTEMQLGLEKLKSIKCFKNGRVDVRFTSEAFAREFAEMFLGNEL